MNLTGGLIGYGHYTGGTGIRQTIDNWKQLTGRAGDFQLKLADATIVRARDQHGRQRQDGDVVRAEAGLGPGERRTRAPHHGGGA